MPHADGAIEQRFLAAERSFDLDMRGLLPALRQRTLPQKQTANRHRTLRLDASLNARTRTVGVAHDKLQVGKPPENKARRLHALRTQPHFCREFLAGEDRSRAASQVAVDNGRSLRRCVVSPFRLPGVT